jgi:hypothetical protein
VTIASGFSGTAQVFQDSLRGQGVLILAAVFAAFVILGILYGSFIDRAARNHNSGRLPCPPPPVGQSQRNAV